MMGEGDRGEEKRQVCAGGMSLLFPRNLRE